MVDQQELTNNSSCRELWTIGMYVERGLEESVLTVRFDADDDIKKNYLTKEKGDFLTSLKIIGAFDGF